VGPGRLAPRRPPPPRAPPDLPEARLLVGEELEAHPAEDVVEALVREGDRLRRSFVPVDPRLERRGLSGDGEHPGVRVEACNGPLRPDPLLGESGDDPGPAGDIEDTFSRPDGGGLHEIGRDGGADGGNEVTLVVLRCVLRVTLAVRRLRHVGTSSGRSLGRLPCPGLPARIRPPDRREPA
jgi:hypothetical protein